MGSPAFSLKGEWASIARGFVIALAGFVAAYLTQTIIPHIDQTNTGGMLAVAGFSVLVNLLRKYIPDTTGK